MDNKVADELVKVWEFLERIVKDAFKQWASTMLLILFVIVITAVQFYEMENRIADLEQRVSEVKE